MWLAAQWSSLSLCVILGSAIGLSAQARVSKQGICQREGARFVGRQPVRLDRSTRSGPERRKDSAEAPPDVVGNRRSAPRAGIDCRRDAVAADDEEEHHAIEAFARDEEQCAANRKERFRRLCLGAEDSRVINDDRQAGDATPGVKALVARRRPRRSRRWHGGAIGRRAKALPRISAVFEGVVCESLQRNGLRSTSGAHRLSSRRVKQPSSSGTKKRAIPPKRDR